jgi:predicted amidohydrolase
MPAKILRIAAAQLKFRRTLPENVELIRRLIAEAAEAGSDVVLFPECALTGYNVDFGKLARGEIEHGLKAVADAARGAPVPRVDWLTDIRARTLLQLIGPLRSAGTREVSLPQDPSHTARR